MLSKRVLWIPLLLLALATTTTSAQSLNGDWNIRSATLHGKDVPSAVLGAMKLNLTANGFTATSQSLQSTGSYTTSQGQGQQITFKIDGGADQGRELKAIYQFVGQDLQICYSENATAPTVFQSTPQNRFLVVVYTKSQIAAAGNRGIPPGAAGALGRGGAAGAAGAGAGNAGLSGPDD